MRSNFQTNSKCNYSILCGNGCKKLHRKFSKKNHILRRDQSKMHTIVVILHIYQICVNIFRRIFSGLRYE